MLIKYLVLLLLGLCAGSVIAAGIFAFLTAIGVFPRLIGKTRTDRHIMLFETMLIIGGCVGCLISFYPSVAVGGGSVVLMVAGISMGIFVGALVMSLSETLNVFPVLVRRVHLAVGIQYVIMMFGIGKMLSSLFYFFNGMYIGVP